MKNVYSTIVTGNPVLAGSVLSLCVGETAAAALLKLDVPIAGQTLQAALTSLTAPGLATTAAQDGFVGVSFYGETPSAELFIKVDGVVLPEAIVASAVASGTFANVPSDSGGAGFLKGVALGIALAQ